LEFKISYNNRLGLHEIAITEFELFCNENNIDYANSGYEELKQSKNFQQRLKELDSKTAKRIRFFPDKICIFKECKLIEIKNSIFIERDAYNTYIELNNIDFKCGIIILYDNKLYFNDIKNVEFEKAFSYEIPVENNIWLCPRKLSKEKYYKWKNKHPKASGTDFAKINIKNFLKIKDL